ncbi:MAG: Hsp20/alpha crystallin family protein [Firmicutes bacterium]|nr:Hsp20/alpha crystallin family protein [Bacillota bacterium]MBR5926533.1 Hsp20/alpha crystallin family protein [Bacillota bacterium]MBR6025311.1 Hsp20/alpha crystallin family protein [Bacillota bacterium]
MFMNSLFGESLFDDFFNDWERPVRSLAPARTANTAVMRTDVREKEGSFELDIDLPGYKKEDVKAELKDGYLTVSAVKNEDKDEKDENGKYLRRERFYGSCSRSFYVGENLKEEDIKAKFEDGILKLSVPKKAKEIPTPKYIAIEG